MFVLPKQRLTSDDKGRDPVSSGRDAGRRCPISRGNDLLRVQKVDTEEADWVECDKDDNKDDGDVCGSEMIVGSLGATDGETELVVST